MRLQQLLGGRVDPRLQGRQPLYFLRDNGQFFRRDIGSGGEVLRLIGERLELLRERIVRLIECGLLEG